MLRIQTWMENNDDFDHILTNVPKVVKLSTQ